MKENIGNSAQLLTFLILAVISGGLAMIIIELHQNNSLERSKFGYQLSIDFKKDIIYQDLENIIYDSKPILDINHGNHNEQDLDNYLEFFEQLCDYEDAGSINKRDIFDYFSDDILHAYHNKEIIAYINQTRKETHDNAYYIKFEKIAKEFDEINRKTKD